MIEHMKKVLDLVNSFLIATATSIAIVKQLKPGKNPRRKKKRRK
ncbi:MAG: hypothetical protein ACE3JK_18880 [Sporolactobacillus sp.]